MIDFFAVRTMTELAIVTCSRTEDQRPSLYHSLTLPSSAFLNNVSKYIADTAFSPTGSQIATITDQGHWSVFDISLKRETASMVCSGNLDMSVLPKGERRTGWWKMEWIDISRVIIAESKGIHLLDLDV